RFAKWTRTGTSSCMTCRCVPSESFTPEVRRSTMRVKRAVLRIEGAGLFKQLASAGDLPGAGINQRRMEEPVGILRSQRQGASHFPGGVRKFPVPIKRPGQRLVGIDALAQFEILARPAQRLAGV